MENAPEENDVPFESFSEPTVPRENIWRDRLNRLLNRRQTNYYSYQDPEMREEDDDEIDDLRREGKQNGYKL